VRLSLVFHTALKWPVDASPLLPERLLPLTVRELAALPLTLGQEQAPLGDLCRIERDDAAADELCLADETACLQRIGFEMRFGRLVVDGAAGGWAGAGMLGGELVVRGEASHGVGAGMLGGLLRIAGNAGERAGGALLGSQHGMQGGVLIVGGSAAGYTGERMRRGLLFIGGDAGEFAGRQMRAGTLLVAGTLTAHAGLGLRRGSIVASRAQSLPAGFSPACVADFTWLRLALCQLQSLEVPLPPGWLEGRFWRYCGDDLEIGKGEILLHDGPQ
jgi:formylmethanofuran dehydrogenase subunit C